MPATKKKKKERKIHITKDANEEIIEAITRNKATFSYVFSHEDEAFSGLDIVVYYEETDSLDRMKDGTSKCVTGFEVDGSAIIADIPSLCEAVENLIISSVKGHVYIDDEEYEFIVYRIMHNVKNFIYSNDMKIKGDR